MLIFGLTGGIASGKSTVSRMLEELGCPVIDADVLARRVVEPGKPAWRAIVGHFGEEILQENGTINRERLGSIVFNDESKRKTLNRCTHPYIRREVLWELAKHFLKGSSYVVLVSPLLFETKYALRYMRQTVVVSCTDSQQLSRLMARDRLSKVEALKRIQAQIPLSCKISCADVEIDNSGSRQDETRGQVEHFVENMKRLSHCRPMLFRKLLVVFALFLFVVFSFFAVS